MGFDMDGVLVDNCPLKVEIANKMGYRIRLADAPSEIIKNILKPDDLMALEIALYHDLKMSLSAKLMPGITDLLKQIKSKDLPYYLISRRSDPPIAIKLLRARGLWPKYFNEPNAFFVVEPWEKNQKAKELGITHYVDDETKVLNVLADVPNKFLFDHLNVFPAAAHYTKVSSHKELSRHFL